MNTTELIDRKSSFATSTQTQRRKIAREVWEAVPTAADLFERPPDPITPINYPDSPAWQIADQECARLLINCLSEPPITEEEIDHYARRFGLSRREAEAEIRRVRYVD